MKKELLGDLLVWVGLMALIWTLCWLTYRAIELDYEMALSAAERSRTWAAEVGR